MTSSGPVIPCRAISALRGQSADMCGYANPFQFESTPVRVDTQCVERSSADGNRICESALIQTENLANASSRSIGALHSVIEPLCANGCFFAEATLHLIGHGNRGHQLAS